MTDTKVLMSLVFINFLMLTGITNFAVYSSKMNCGEDIINPYLNIENMGSGISIEKDSQGNPILKEDKTSEFEVFPNMADVDITTDSCELYKQWAKDWGDTPILGNVYRWLEGTCVDVTDWKNTVTVDVSGIAKPVYSFYSTIKLLLFYPNCTGIPTILMALIFMPTIVGVAYILIKLFPFTGGG